MAPVSRTRLAVVLLEYSDRDCDGLQDLGSAGIQLADLAFFGGPGRI